MFEGVKFVVNPKLWGWEFGAFLCAHASEPAPLAHGELRLPKALRRPSALDPPRIAGARCDNAAW